MNSSSVSRRVFVVGSAGMLATGLMGLHGCGGSGAATDESDAESGSGATETESSAEPLLDESYMILEERDDGSRVMNDTLGPIEVPEESFRIACTAPAHTSALLLLGAVDKIVAIDQTFANGGWILSKYPQLADVPVVFANNETNMEELLNQSPDLVTYASRYGDETLQQLQDLGIVCTGGMLQEDGDDVDFINRVRDNAAYYGLVVGGDQAQAAKNYRTEFTAIREEIQSRTADIAEADRPTVCEISSAGQQLQVNNGTAIGQMLIDLAGGVNVAKDAAGESAGPSGQTIIEPETLLGYNPDILIIDNQGFCDELKKDPVLSQLDAIVNGRVYIAPTGAMSWPYNGPEEYLNMYFFAKCIQPELFADIDMEAEAKAFYEKYFGFDLDDEDIKSIFALEDGQTVADIFNK
ncbi:ABC transporter substrate-binding protein [Slackia heliotrinireducens]|uniref:ABC transporter substrate-binding protein n=1 Tax=Slackia heliotrinireducens TaxID=84110 RepID=UPI00331616DB